MFELRRHGWLVVVTMILAGFICLLFDVPLAKLCLDGSMPGELRGLFARSELFGHAYGLLFASITIYLLDPNRRWRIPRLVTVGVTAGLTADCIKLMVWRTRPRSWALLEQAPNTWLGTIFTASSVDLSIVRNSNQQSFPSAHTAMAVALAIGLTRVYPRGKWLFWSLALFCGFNRIDGGAHFASDVCWGAALGTAVTIVTDRSAWFAQSLSKVESRLERSSIEVERKESLRIAA